jgi:hypothetical protein
VAFARHLEHYVSRRAAHGVSAVLPQQRDRLDSDVGERDADQPPPRLWLLALRFSGRFLLVR